MSGDSNLELERKFRDNKALELILHSGYRCRRNDTSAWYLDTVPDDYSLRVYDYGMVSFGQRIDGRMIWFNVSDTCEQLILETVGAWQR
jgi:hypothetical protein